MHNYFEGRLLRQKPSFVVQDCCKVRAEVLECVIRIQSMSKEGTRVLLHVRRTEFFASSVFAMPCSGGRVVRLRPLECRKCRFDSLCAGLFFRFDVHRRKREDVDETELVG